MKRLYVLRHSKAGQTNKKVLDDHERVLTEKGVELCPYIGEYLKNSDILPDFIVCSTALRAKQTAEHVLSEIGKDIDIQYFSRLYLAKPEMVFSVLQGLDPNIQNVLLIGHNPGLQQFSMELSGRGDKKKYREMRSNFPTAAMASFNLKSDEWVDVEIQSGELIDYVVAKNLKKAALKKVA